MKLSCFINFVILLLLQIYMACYAEAVTNIATDQAALLALKSHITSDPYNILTRNWSASAPVCSWVGVHCDAYQNRVIKLDLSDMGLTASIPSQIGNLSFLTFLSIRNNSFFGSPPSELTHLTRLKYTDFGFNHFTGVIPPYLGSFPNLESLFIDENNFFGNLPSSFSNSTSLKRINISHNQLSGLIPSSSSHFKSSSLQIIDFSFNSLYGELPVDIFYHLPKLQELYLSGNQISGAIPYSLLNSKQLQILSLSDNRFTGNIPAEIGNLSILKKLYLDHNHLTGSIPISLGNCTSLQEIYLSENILTAGDSCSTALIMAGEIPPMMGELGSLEVLRIHGNAFTGRILATLFNSSLLKSISAFSNCLSGGLPSTMGLFLPNLVELRLGGNALNGIIPSSISNASNLVFLDLSDNSFGGFIPVTLGNLRYLQGLSLANNHLTTSSSTPDSSFLTTLTNCKQLRTIKLSDNPLNITLPVSIGNFSSSLQQFWANDCNNRGRIPREIGNLTSLIALSLKNNEFTGTIPATIGRLEKLQGLYLEGNKLQGTIISNLCRLGNLAYLSFGGNELVGHIPECLANLTALRSLNFSSNQLNSTIPSAFWTLKDIMAINMSSNSLSGFIPSSIAMLKVVEEIDLSSNQLSGEIPITIRALESLTHLCLAKNRFQGLIPQSISSLKGLELLDLSHNNLTGIIPESLETLLYLKHFNVSVNRLEGEIPSQGPFSNFSAKSYMMNKALCGPSRLLVPPCKAGVSQVVFLLKLMMPLVLSMLLAYYIFLWVRCRKRNENSLNAKALDRYDKLQELLNKYVELQDRRYTYLELQQATDLFSESNLLGSGHSGKVYKGTLKDGKAVAIKVFNVEEQSSLKSFEVECQILSSFNHRCSILTNARQGHFVKLICISNSVNFKALVMEYLANGSLDKWLHTHNYHLDILQRLLIITETAKAVRYLHQQGIIHCDLKPSNILLDEDMVAHVSDFSIAKLGLVSKSYTRESKLICTFGYAAPEYGLNGTVSELTDVYSFGTLIMETFTGKKPTDEMFTGEMSLRSWVSESLPGNVERVVDPSLLLRTEEDYNAKRECLSIILKLAQTCTAESPKERLYMTTVENILMRSCIPRLRLVGS